MPHNDNAAVISHDAPAFSFNNAANNAVIAIAKPATPVNAVRPISHNIDSIIARTLVSPSGTEVCNAIVRWRHKYSRQNDRDNSAIAIGNVAPSAECFHESVIAKMKNTDKNHVRYLLPRQIVSCAASCFGARMTICGYNKVSIKNRRND